MKKTIKLSDPSVSQKSSKPEASGSGSQPVNNSSINIAGTSRGLVTPDQFLSPNRLALTNPLNFANSPSCSKTSLRRQKAKNKLEARTEPHFAGFKSRNSYAMDISPTNTMLLKQEKSFAGALQTPQKPLTALEVANRFAPIAAEGQSSNPVVSNNRKNYFANKSDFHYIEKPFFQRIFVLEPYMINRKMDNPRILADHHISRVSNSTSAFCHPPHCGPPSQRFHEFILVDSRSIDLQEISDSLDDKKITHCKVRIRNIIAMSEWGDPNRTRRFSRPFSPQEYNYWDYRDAWFQAFYRQNEAMSMSFFFYFDEHLLPAAPYWFIEWWDKFGLETSIFPANLKDVFEYWNERAIIPAMFQTSPSTYIFACLHKLTWIFQPRFMVKEKQVDMFEVPYFGRQHFIKWWAGTNCPLKTRPDVDAWFSRQPAWSLGKPSPADQQFLVTKTQMQARLAQAQSLEETQAIMQQFLPLLQSDKSKTSSASSKAGSNYGDDDMPDDVFGNSGF